MSALQGAVATAAIALSAFSLITYLWLGLTVLLLGNRQALVTWVGGVGLLTAALFFLCHGALVEAGLVTGAGLSDVWWHLAWLPAFTAPLFWAAIGLHYVGLAGAWGRMRVLALSGAAALGGLAAVLALVNWPAIASYGDFIRLLAVSLGIQEAAPAGAGPLASPALPALGVAFVAYLGACACLPWASLVARRFMPGIDAVLSARAESEQGQLWDPGSAWSQARPALLAASLCMVVAGAVVGLVGILTAFATRATHATHTTHAARPPVLLGGLPASGHLPLALVVADLVVQTALAGLVLMLGWAVVSQGVLVERRLPQRGFLGHWRGTVVVAGVVAGLVAGLSAIEPAALPMLLVVLALVAATYALFTWQSYAAHDRFLEQLRPFVDSLATGRGGWLATHPQDVERAVEALFNSLCRDVLQASDGRLALAVGHLHRTFTYHAPDAERAEAATHEWVLPIADERGVVARLSLGPRVDGAGYTSADLEVARACGQRILDAVGEFTAVQTIAQLARRRGLETELSAALPRRKIHDDVLPRLHLAMLRLEGLRGYLGEEPHGAESAGAARSAGVAGAVEATRSRTATGELATDVGGTLAEVVQELGGVHRDLAALLRRTPAATPRRLERGLCAALQAALDGEFRGAFDSLTCEIPKEARAPADHLPDIVADLLLGATLEAVRNASRHGRGGDLHRPLGMRITLGADEQWVRVVVADDGVGIQPALPREGGRATRSAEGGATREGMPALAAGDSPSGPMPIVSVAGGPAVGEGAGASTRSGLLTHSALLALVGGTLAVHSAPNKGGTRVTLRVPRVLEAPGV